MIILYQNNLINDYHRFHFYAEYKTNSIAFKTNEKNWKFASHRTISFSETVGHRKNWKFSTKSSYDKKVKRYILDQLDTLYLTIYRKRKQSSTAIFHFRYLTSTGGLFSLKIKISLLIYPDLNYFSVEIWRINLKEYVCREFPHQQGQNPWKTNKYNFLFTFFRLYFRFSLIFLNGTELET